MWSSVCVALNQAPSVLGRRASHVRLAGIAARVASMQLTDAEVSFLSLSISVTNAFLVVQACAAAIAIVQVTLMSESVAVAEEPTGAQVLIRRPRTTPPSSSSELSSNSGEEDESPTGWESEGGRREQEESVDVGIIDLLMEADANAEDLILEGQLRTLWEHMSTMHSMVLELMSEVELINLELKKRRSH
jgi:hypothetical protein